MNGRSLPLHQVRTIWRTTAAAAAVTNARGDVPQSGWDERSGAPKAA